MKSTFGWLTLSATLLLSTASLATDNSNTSTKSSNASQDGQILEWIMVVDKNEMAAGKAAMQKSKDPSVKKYARELINDHTKNLSQAMAVSRNIHVKPIPSDDSKKLKQEGKDLMAKLKGLKDKEFDKEYINAMVTGHTDALSSIESKMEQVSNPKLHNFANVTKDMIQRHLTDGKTVQQTMQ